MNRKLFTILGLALFLFCAAAVQAKPVVKAKPAAKPAAKVLPFKAPLGAKATLDTVFFDNFESDTLVWDTMDVLVQDTAYWHIDAHNAYSGNSWWCGTDAYAGSWANPTGYGVGWIQYLYSPDLNLTTGADSVILSFYHKYNVEPGDWDCCNLWGSTDGGSTWFLLIPDNARTPSDGLYNLTDALSWCYMGLTSESNNIKGWGGNSNGWKQVYFDLTAYKNQTIKLRYSMVSDWAECDEDGAFYDGAWYVDNIQVDTLTNGGANGVLFYDNVESGANGWTAGVKVPRINWQKTTANSVSPSTSFYSGTENWGHSDALISPYIDLSKVQSTQPCLASFMLWVDFPGPYSDYTRDWDYFDIEISDDNGKTWDFAGQYLPAATQKTWIPIESALNYVSEISLNSYIGKSVLIRISVCTDEKEYGGEGFYIDDFIVTGKTQDPLPPASTVCLVDNDGTATDVSENSWTKYMEASLANLGYKYSLATIGSNKAMTPGYLEQYPLVIWNLGPNYDFRVNPEYKALTATDQACILSYLNNGGSLWMAGQYFFSAGGALVDTTVHPNLWRDYLHLAPENGWAATTTYQVYGVAGDPIGDGLADSLLYSPLNGGYPWTGPEKAYSLNPDTANYPVVGFTKNDDSTFSGLRYHDAGLGYNLIYSSFPYEAVSTPEKRDTMMARAINWLKPGLTGEYMPPAVPQGLALAQSYDTIKCVWLANAEADIKGYNVYRSLQSGIPSWIKVGTVLHPDTAFADTTVQAGLTYNYAITAFDTSIAPVNESLKSLWLRIYVIPWKLGIEEQPLSVVPARFSLEQNKPNPFKGSTEIQFALPNASRVELGIYNVAGQKVAALASGAYPAGYHSIRWNGQDGQGRALSNGVYFYRLEARGQNGQERLSQTKRLIIVK